MTLNNVQLPGGMEHRPHPDSLKRQPDTSRREKTDWTWVGRAVFARPSSWCRIAKDQPNKNLAKNINAGRIAAFDPELVQADPVRVQSSPNLYDIYVRARFKPGGVENPTQREIDQHMQRVGNLRREWRETWLLQWIKVLADSRAAGEDLGDFSTGLADTEDLA